MTVTLTHETTLSRVKITANGLAAADEATIERSTDQIRWTTVRGGTGVGVTAGVTDLPVYDYEFAPGVINYYRVRGVETGAITYVGAGAAATGNNASVVPALPASLVVGDQMVCLASIRNSGTGTVNTPTGWEVLRAFGNCALLGRRYQSGDTAPTITFAGGVANADTIAQIAAWRRAHSAPLTGADQLNASAQNINYPALTITQDGNLILLAGWKQDDWTSVATLGLTGAAEIGEPSSVAGDDAGQVWDYLIQTTAANIAAGSFTVTGGASAISRAALLVLPHAPYLNEQTANITPPALTTPWLKSVARPFLNMPVELAGDSFAIARPARAGVFDVVGRSLPVAVTDVRGSRRYTLIVRTDDEDDTQALDLLLASGDTLYLHAPEGQVVPAGGVYLSAGDSSQVAPIPPDTLRLTSIPVTEVAAPGPDVIGAQSTCQTVLNTYASITAVIAAHASIADLLTLIGDPTEVIVP